MYREHTVFISCRLHALLSNGAAFYSKLNGTKIMACRQVWISNKNVCVLYHVTAAAGLLREPQPRPS